MKNCFCSHCNKKERTIVAYCRSGVKMWACRSCWRVVAYEAFELLWK